ncbi:hypothetical protein QE152_g7748 [Popillia japonica]|uniref:Integrase catalytic domain-containing protein n=1 Tax=Popillia japonica TaxID=7064 RepID=A0AAW1MEG0_POPJA
MGDAIQCDISPTDINAAHRVAQLNSNSSRPRNIIVSLVSRRKRDEILAAAKMTRSRATLIVCLTETWLNPNILTSEISNIKYSIFRRDRCTTASKKADGGGVLIALDNTLQASMRLDWQSQAEYLWITIWYYVTDHIELALLEAINKTFFTFGTPKRLKSDNGPPFNVNELKKFLASTPTNIKKQPRIGQKLMEWKKDL